MERKRKRRKTTSRANVLNLRDFIPQVDIIKMILRKLDKLNWQMIWIAHNSKNKNLIPQTFIFACSCAEKGYSNLLKWALENECPIGEMCSY
jgi:hypothetical protein